MNLDPIACHEILVSKHILLLGVSTMLLACSTAPQLAPATGLPTKADTIPETPSSSWDRYEVRSLSDVFASTEALLEEEAAEYPDKVSYYVQPFPEYQLPSLATVTYTGDFRETSENKRFLIYSVMAQMRPGEEDQFAALYKQEALFIEDGVDYWLPIQQRIVPYLKEEAEVGSSVTLFVLWVGAVLDSGEFDRVFMVNEFRADE